MEAVSYVESLCRRFPRVGDLHPEVFAPVIRKYGLSALNAFLEFEEILTPPMTPAGFMECFEEHYIGRYDTPSAFGAEMWNFTDNPDVLPYVDFDRFGRDLVLGGDFLESRGYYFYA